MIVGILLAVSLTACGGSGQPPKSPDTEPAPESVEETEGDEVMAEGAAATDEGDAVEETEETEEVE